MAVDTLEQSPDRAAAVRGAGPAYREPFVPPPPRRREGLNVPLVESALIFLVFAGAFTLLGYQVVVEQHVVVFEALDRLTRAYMVWFNDPPKLAAIGFSYPPVTTIAFMPFAALKPLATSGIALPLTSAVFAGATLAILNRIFAVVEMNAGLRYVLLLAVALNPMFAFYATNGQSEAVYLCFLAFSLYSFLAWFVERQPRYLIGAGLAFSVAMLTRYEFIIWAIFVAFLIAGALIRARVRRDEVEGSVIAYLAPIIYALTLWVFFNILIVGDPFGWLDPSLNPTVTNPNISGQGADFGSVIERLFELEAGVSLLGVVMVPVLLVVFAIYRNVIALAFALLIAINFVATALSAFFADEQGVMELSDAMPAMLTAIVAAAWLFYSFGDGRLVVYGLTLALAVVSIPLAWNAMKQYPYQNLEQAFTRAISTGKDQEGRSSRGGYAVGTKPEQDMAAFVKQRVKRRSSILTDNAQTFGVILLTGRPELFLDRVDKGDTRWRRIAGDPRGKTKVDYFLVAQDANGDVLRQRYPEAADNDVANLEVVYFNSRYTLLRVRGRPRRPAQAQGGQQQTRTQAGQPTQPQVPAAPAPADELGAGGG